MNVRGCVSQLSLATVLLLSLSGVARATPLPEGLYPVASLSGLSANDWTMWSQLGGDQTAVNPSFTATSAAGVGITGTFAGGNQGGMTSVVCPAPPAPFTFPCSWTGGNGGTQPFTAGDTLLWTMDTNGNTNGPLTLTANTTLTGMGLLLQADYPGQFTAQIQSGTTIYTEQSDASGDPIFIGLVGVNGATLNSITLSLTACTGDGCPTSDFAVDTLYTSGGPAASPEPSLFFPAAAVIAALLWHNRKRAQVRFSDLRFSDR